AVNATDLSEDNDSIGNVPDLPLILQGEMNVNGESISAGSDIMAYYGGELIAKSTAGEEGKYSLNLNLTPENYTNIENVELYVNGDKVSFDIPVSQIETIQNTASGSIIKVNINSSVSSIDNDTDSGGSSGLTGEARVVNKDTDESETSYQTEGHSEANLAGEYEDDITNSEGPVSQVDDEEGEDLEDVEGGEDIEGAEDAEGAEGTEDAGYSTVFTALLFVAAFFGALMVIKK
ncbi:MAG: hypothetical protein QG610_345, partial [Euryarchaeota archaeon]|nr:hypothetical protein [Euryarchaeota archaeon]